MSLIRPRARARSPERAALAEAIAAQRAIEARLTGITSGLDAVRETVIACQIVVRRATEAVEAAKVSAAEYITAQALGTSGEAPRTIKEARAALQDAEDDLSAAKAARETLALHEQEARESLSYALVRSERAARAVFLAEVPIERMIEEYNHLCTEAENRRRAIEFAIMGRDTHRDTQGNLPSFRTNPFEMKVPGAEPWKAFLDDLSNNADAAMPPA